MSYDIHKRSAIAFTEAGAAAGCVFCKARMINAVAIGERYISLESYKTGQAFTVVSEVGYNENEFLAHFEGQPERHLTRIFWSEYFCRHEDYSAQTWHAPLSVEDNLKIEKSILSNMIRYGIKSNEFPIAVASTIWRNRLPITSFEIEKILNAHGFSISIRNRLSEKMEFSLQVLLFLNGMKPIKRKRMEPFSTPRYTPLRRKLT